MADFFEDLGKRITDAASSLGKKTEDTIEIQKLKSDIRSLKRSNDRDFPDMDLITFCESIEKRDEEIEKKEEEITRIRGEE